MDDDGILYAWSTKARMIMAMKNATTRASIQSLAALFFFSLFKGAPPSVSLFFSARLLSVSVSGYSRSTPSPG
jgi:hypothetical protein